MELLQFNTKAKAALQRDGFFTPINRQRVIDTGDDLNVAPDESQLCTTME